MNSVKERTEKNNNTEDAPTHYVALEVRPLPLNALRRFGCVGYCEVYESAELAREGSKDGVQLIAIKGAA